MLQRSTSLRLARAALLATGGALSFTATSLWAPDAFAKKPVASAEKSASNAPGAIMVRPFKGPKAKTIGDAVIRAFEKADITLVPAGFEGDVELGDESGPYVTVARENSIQAFVTGQVKMAKKGWSLEIGIRNGSDGQILGSEMLTAKNLPGLLETIKSDLLEVLDGRLKEAKPPGAEEASSSSDDAGADGDASTSTGDDVQSPAPEATRDADTSAVPIDVTLSGIGGFRRFAYNQPIGDAAGYALQDHNLPYFGARLAGHWYPGAHFTTGVLANIGFAASYYQSIGAQTKVGAPINKTFASSVTELALGLRARIPLGDGYRLGINAGWGKQQTMIKDRTQQENDTGVVPDADYTFYRFGPDFEAGWGGLNWNLGAMYRIISLGKGVGQIGHALWFPGATAGAIEVNLDVGIPLSKQWSIVVGGEFLQVGLDMRSKPDAVNANGDLQHAVAGGAIDRYLMGNIGIRWKLDTTPDAATPAATPAAETSSTETSSAEESPSEE